MIHGRIFKISFVSLTAVGLFLTSSQWSSAQNLSNQDQVTALAKSEGDTTNFQFSGKDNWEYKVERVSPTELLLTIPKVRQDALGNLIQFADGWVKRIDSVPSDSVSLSKFKVTLSSAEVEHFDYLTDQPSRLIIDIYKKETQPNAEITEQKPSSLAFAKTLPTKKRTQAPVTTNKSLDSFRKLNNREPASSEILDVEVPEEISPKAYQFLQGIFDSGDSSYKRFQIRSYEVKEESIIAAKDNIYIRFPILKLPTTRLTYYKENPPEFIIEPKDNVENKEARLLKTLFDNKRWTAFLKTFDLFNKKFPESKYEEILKHLAAQVHYELWQRDKNPADYKIFNDYLNYVSKKFVDSPLRERTEMLIASHDLERGSGLETLQRFQKLLQTYPESRDRDWIKKGIAEGYLILNKYDEALATYKDLEKSYVQEAGGIEGAYRQGDVFFRKWDYKEAVVQYKAAIKKHPNYQDVFPNAYYNLAESQFWLGDYKESLDHFLTFIRLFPAHSYGGFALTRIGELLEVLGAEKSKVLGAYLESQFRFQGSEGAKIARIRTLSQRMKGMRDAELKKTEKEFIEIAETTNLPKMHEFVTLMRADGYHNRVEYKKAYDGLIEYYQKNPTTTNLAFFKDRIVSYMADEINQMVNEKKFLNALARLDTFGRNWLLNTTRYDIPYFQAHSFEQAGLINDSEKIYSDLLSKIEKISGTQEEKERKVVEHYPSKERIYLRLANVQKEQRRYADALKSLSKIQNDNELNDEEKVEKVEVASNLFELRNEPKVAVQYLSKLKKNWENDPRLVAEINLRLAKQQLAIPDAKSALSSIKEIEDSVASESIKPKQEFAKNFKTVKAEALLADNQPVAAVEVFVQVLNEFENQDPMPGLRFKTGKILYDQGDFRGAEKIWEQIKGPSSDVYQKLAQERLNDLKWKDEYKKYIDRIPATKDFKSVR